MRRVVALWAHHVLQYHAVASEDGPEVARDEINRPVERLLEPLTSRRPADE